MNLDPRFIILDGCIALGDAFQQALNALEDTGALVVTVPDEDDPSLQTYDDTAYRAATRRVEYLMRNALADGELPALARDPVTGLRVELTGREKWRRMSFGGFGIKTFVDSLTNPGPDTTGGFAVMLKQELFDQWLASAMRKAGRKTLSMGRRGRPPAVNWEMVETELCRLMDENGEFMAGDADWNVRAKLEGSLMDFISTTFNKTEVGQTTLRDNIRPMLARWRESQDGK